MSQDPELESVRRWLSMPGRVENVGVAIRLAFDWVIDGPRTRRFSVDQLETTEKIYIGNRVELEMLDALKLKKAPPLDTHIGGVEVDIKFSLRKNWMIPPEALGHVCVLVTASDETSLFSLGIIRATDAVLGAAAGNRDGKRNITQVGRSRVVWIAESTGFPDNLLRSLDAETRESIFTQQSGTRSVVELFRRVLDIPISRNAIDTVAKQRDPSKRVRQARKELAAEGIRVLSGKYDSAILLKLQLPKLRSDEFISTRRN